MYLIKNCDTNEVLEQATQDIAQESAMEMLYCIEPCASMALITNTTTGEVTRCVR